MPHICPPGGWTAHRGIQGTSDSLAGLLPQTLSPSSTLHLRAPAQRPGSASGTLLRCPPALGFLFGCSSPSPVRSTRGFPGALPATGALSWAQGRTRPLATQMQKSTQPLRGGGRETQGLGEVRPRHSRGRGNPAAWRGHGGSLHTQLVPATCGCWEEGLSTGV